MHFNDNIDALNTIRFINGTNRSIFLTGKAGSGKTTLLRNIVQHTHKHTVIVAPTGIAALHAGGVTIHSMFQLPFGAFAPAAHIDINHISFELHTLAQLPKEIVKLSSAKRNIIRHMELLIIDEVSMLRADLLDAIDTVLRHIRRRRNDVFGGVQVLFIGDMLQLPPIVKDDEWNYLQKFYKSLYFFDALAFTHQKPIVIELQKIYRQTDQMFVGILNNLRNNIFTSHDLQILNERYIPNFKAKETDSYIFVTTHNRKADAINAAELKQLKGGIFTYKAFVQNDFPEHLYPVDYTLELKVGAQVMCIKNDYSGGSQYYNGKIGKISALDSNTIELEFPDTGNTVTMDLYTWENKRYVLNHATGTIDETVIGTFTHFPIKLAWAVTVHKSQGLTFKQAIIDVSEAFAPGQIYVALSRLESLEGLVLSQPIVDDAPDQSQRLLQFTNARHTHSDLDSEYSKAAQEYLHTTILQTFDFNSVMQELQYHIDTYTKEENRSTKQQFLPQIQEIKKDLLPIVDIGDKFSKQLQTLIYNNSENTVLKERIQKAYDYFEPLLTNISKKICAIINLLNDLRGVKAYATELKNLEVQYFNKLQKIKKCIALIDAIVSNETIKKETFASIVHDSERSRILEQPIVKGKKGKKIKSEKSYKEALAKPIKDTRHTREISFDLYTQGKTIADIAAERELTSITIEKHLAYFVAEGMLDATELIDKQTLQTITKTIKTLQTKSLKEVKDALPDDISYTEIRFAMAYLESR